MSLVTLADIKVFLGIAPADTSQDALITMFQQSVEQSVINYCESDFTAKVISGIPGEILDSGRSDVLVPKNFPIISVEEVWFNVEADGTGGFKLDGTRDYYHDEGAIILRTVYSPFSRGIIRLNYTWGYTGVPADVKMSVYQSVKAEMQRYNRNTEDLSSRSKEGESESYRDSWDALTGLPTQIVAKLQPYKVYEFGNIAMAQRNL